MYSQDLRERITNLDNDILALYGYKCQPEITIVGGSALMLLGELPANRFTTDIDVLEFSDELRNLLTRYDMNTDVSTFLYNFPSSWRERRQQINLDTICLKVFTMSLEDLVIAKLLASRKSDWSDLSNLSESNEIDWEALQSIINNPLEIQVNLNTDEQWSDFLKAYKKLLSLKDKQ
jgi:hypothetical protein